MSDTHYVEDLKTILKGLHDNHVSYEVARMVVNSWYDANKPEQGKTEYLGTIHSLLESEYGRI